MKTEARGLHMLGPNKSSAEKTQSLIVIECTVCHYLGFAYMAYPEVEVLLNDGTVVRQCPTCGTKTNWRKVNTHPGANKQRGNQADAEEKKKASNF